MEIDSEMDGILSRDEWLERNPQISEIQTLLERCDFTKFMAQPVVLDRGNAVVAKATRVSSLRELMGMLETTSFSHIYQIVLEDNKFLVRGQFR